MWDVGCEIFLVLTGYTNEVSEPTTYTALRQGISTFIQPLSYIPRQRIPAYVLSVSDW